MRMITRFLILLGMVALVAACAIIPPPPRTLLISEAKLAQLIASQFPFKGEMLEVLDVNVSHPRISLDPAHNRINTAFDVAIEGNGLIGLLTDKTYRGGIDMSYGLHFEPADGTIRLTDIHVSRLDIDGAPKAMDKLVDRLGPQLARKLLKDYVIYKVHPDDLRAGNGWRYAPGDFRVEPNGLSLTLTPVAEQ